VKAGREAKLSTQQGELGKRVGSGRGQGGSEAADGVRDTETKVRVWVPQAVRKNQMAQKSSESISRSICW